MATAKAKELHLKLATVINTIGKGTPFAAGPIPLQDTEHHSHKKSRGVSSQSVAGVAALSHSYLSPQRKGTRANKRLSLQSPGRFCRAHGNNLYGQWRKYIRIMRIHRLCESTYMKSYQ